MSVACQRTDAAHVSARRMSGRRPIVLKTSESRVSRSLSLSLSQMYSLTSKRKLNLLQNRSNLFLSWSVSLR